MNRVQSKDHNIELYKTNKISLCSHDNEEYSRKDGYSTLSHFYKSTR